MPVLIRPATHADVPGITGIYAHSVIHETASFELEPPNEAVMCRRMEKLLGEGFPYLVAERNGRIGGYAYAGSYRTRPAYRFTVENSIYVAPDQQRRGIGRTLLNALIEACEKRGFRQMIAVIGDSTRQQASIGFHSALGFQHVGILNDVGYKHGRWLDSVLMQRRLGDGGDTSPS
jgi:L-amino acid N-acyltransferase YncA